MRNFLILVIGLAIGVAAWFGFQQYKTSETVNPLSLVPKNTQVIIRCGSSEELAQMLQDTNHVFDYFFGSFGIDSNILRLLQPIVNIQQPLLLSFNETGGLTLITEGNLDEFTSQLSDFTLSVQHNFHVLSSKGSSTEVLEEQEFEAAKHAFSSFLHKSQIEIVFKTSALDRFLLKTFANPIYSELKKQLPAAGWCAFEGQNTNHRLVINGMSAEHKQDNNALIDNNLLRYIPAKTGLTLFNVFENTAYAISYANYTTETLNGHENVFFFFKNDSISADKSSVDYNGVPISASSLPHAEKLVFVPEWSAEAFKAKIGNVSIYGSSFEQLSKLIDDYLADDKVQNSSYYKLLSDVATEAGFGMYLCPERMAQPNPFVNFNAGRASKLNALLFQSFSEMPGQTFYSLAALHHTEIVDKAPIFWTTTLDTSVCRGPWLFQNHYTKEPELLVQDYNHQLYLLNREGKVLWRKQLDEEIVGDIDFMDGFDNGKFQLLFNTKSKSHLIDRNGKYIEKYPVALLDSTAVAPLAVKYSKKSDYRIITCNGTKLINLDANGDNVKGWKKPDLKAPLKETLIYTSVQGNEMFIALTNDHKVHFYDKTGVRAQKPITVDPSMIFLAFEAGKSLAQSKIIGYDSLGNIHTVMCNGEKSATNILPLGSDVGMLYNENKTHHFLTIKGDHLIGLNDENNVTLDYIFNESMLPQLQLADANRGWIALSTKDQKHIYLFDLEGAILNKMPVEGSGKCLITDLDLNQSPELIAVKNSNQIVAYKVNK